MSHTRVILGVGLLCLAHIWIAWSLPIQAITFSQYDDAHFIEQAAHILNGQWLGPYDALTLIKGPLYPLWIAAIWMTGLPILVSQAILYIAAGGLLLLAARPGNSWTLGHLLTFAAYVFNPMLFNIPHLRVIREGLYVPQTVMIVALAAWCLRERTADIRRRLLWAGTLGIALGLYWVNREEGVWIIPGLAIIWAGLLRGQYQSRGGLSLKVELLIASCSAIAALGVIQCVAFLNWRHYGVGDIVEFKQREFVSAYGALSRIREKSSIRRIPLSRAAMDKIAAVSPSFRELRSRIDPDWSHRSCLNNGVRPCDGELRGGELMWALREAAGFLGHYRSADASRAFYLQMAEEINEACISGRLDCLESRTTMLPPFRMEDLRATARVFRHAVRYLVTLDDLAIGLPVSPPSPGLEAFEGLTHSRTLVPAAAAVETKLPLVLRALTAIGWLYQAILPWCAALALPLFALQVVQCIRLRADVPGTWLSLSLLILITSRLMFISYIDATTFPAVNTLYLSPVYPLLALFCGLTASDGARILRQDARRE